MKKFTSKKKDLLIDAEDKEYDILQSKMDSYTLEDKIKLSDRKEENLKFIYEDEILVVQPYISALDIDTANDICIAEFLREIEDTELTRYDIFPNVKIAYDLHVIHSCTNLDYESTFGVYDSLVSSGLVELITRNIVNYESTWNIILEGIKLRNTFIGLNLIENRIPDPKEFDKNMKDFSKMLTKIEKENPSLLKKIAETSMYQGVIDNVNEKNNADVKKKGRVKKEIISLISEKMVD